MNNINNINNINKCLQTTTTKNQKKKNKLDIGRQFKSGQARILFKVSSGLMSGQGEKTPTILGAPVVPPIILLSLVTS